ncbi:hypothetical protein PGT21_030088 [Puccinia graminis f. sp. tritici]|uniref:Uncharacterized protein n=1 Tax=Puccinia graminis f. sp. tritici TaxID=56615 RepID=A0A5B0N5M2_PUCGR|nr:hypothetical protein PGT21_030088 [Puccinia graminis f. sp. tritici]
MFIILGNDPLETCKFGIYMYWIKIRFEKVPAVRTNEAAAAGGSRPPDGGLSLRPKLTWL